MRVHSLFALPLALAAILAFAGVARAQSILPQFADRAPAEFVNAAFSAEYGRKVVAEFGRILRASANAECLRSRAIDPDSMEEHARAVLVAGGTRMYAAYFALLDAGKLEAALAALAGQTASSEFTRLRSDPDVKRLLELDEPGRLAGVVLKVAENVDRHRESGTRTGDPARHARARLVGRRCGAPHRQHYSAGREAGAGDRCAEVDTPCSDVYTSPWT